MLVKPSPYRAVPKSLGGDQLQVYIPALWTTMRARSGPHPHQTVSTCPATALALDNSILLLGH